MAAHRNYAASYSGGYDVLFVDDHDATTERYRCIICHMVCRDVHQANCCGALMCHHCLETQKRHSNNCPKCRTVWSRGTVLFQDKKRQQEIIDLKVYCANRIHGCTWQGELLYYERDHKKLCTFNLATCPECYDKVPEQTLGDHRVNRCRKRIYNCPYCNKQGIFEDIEANHLPICPEHPVGCPNGCLASIKRKEIEAHRRQCSQQLVPCRYKEQGCNILIKREEKVNHEKQCSKRHIQVGIQLPSLLPAGDILPINVCMDQFQSRKENKGVWEHSFFTCEKGYFMSLTVHVGGCSRHEDRYMSCYIHLKRGPHDEHLQWPFKGIFVVELLNQKEDKQHYGKEIKFITSGFQCYNNRVNCEKAMIGLGEPEYISHDHLHCNSMISCKYLENDSVHFRISLKSPESCNAKQWPPPCFGRY